MAAKTPDSTLRESVGSLTLHIATFSTNDIDNGDTWTSGIEGIAAQWVQQTDDAADTQFGIAASLTDSTTGEITFNTDEDNKTALVFVLAKS